MSKILYHFSLPIGCLSVPQKPDPRFLPRDGQAGLGIFRHNYPAQTYVGCVLPTPDVGPRCLFGPRFGIGYGTTLNYVVFYKPIWKIRNYSYYLTFLNKQL